MMIMMMMMRRRRRMLLVSAGGGGGGGRGGHGGHGDHCGDYCGDSDSGCSGRYENLSLRHQNHSSVHIHIFIFLHMSQNAAKLHKGSSAKAFMVPNAPKASWQHARVRPR